MNFREYVYLLFMALPELPGSLTAVAPTRDVLSANCYRSYISVDTWQKFPPELIRACHILSIISVQCYVRNPVW
jgi:hypothetical protein